jgi:hypothetical protein
MDINKAIRKQEKSHKMFLLFLGFIFLFLPGVLFLSGNLNLFLLVYLVIIELLILIAVLVSINNNFLNYTVDGYKLRLQFKKFGGEINIVCDKVSFVHTEGSGSEMNIVMLTTSKFRNKKISEVDEEFLKRHSYVALNYYRIKKLNPEINYYYIIISKGNYHKYRLLDMIYRNCVKAQYTEETVERIKEYRRF